MEETNPKPWSDVGVEVDINLSSREMLYKAKLDWEVSKIPSQRPKSHGNQETIRFFKGYFEAGEAPIESIGSLDGSRIIWGLARLNESFTLKERDTVQGYILLASRDENREKIEVKFLAVRENNHSMLQIASKGKPYVKNIFRKTFKQAFSLENQKQQKFDDAVNSKMNAMITLGREAFSAFEKDAQRLTDKTVDEPTAWRFMLNVFQSETTKDISTLSVEELKELAESNTLLAMKAFSRAPGQNLASSKDTAWGLLNAVTYIIDHQLGKSQDSRLRLAWFGANAKLKKRALELASAL